MVGYVRQRDAQISNLNIINADDLDAEFNQVQSSHNAVTGHKHDGSSGEGAPITKVGPVQDVTISAVTVAPKTDNVVSLGTALLRFKDAFISGVLTAVSFVGNLTGNVTGNLTGNVNGNITGNVTGNLVGNVDATTVQADVVYADTSIQLGIGAGYTNIQAPLGEVRFEQGAGNLLRATTSGTLTVGQPAVPVYTRNNIVGVVGETAGVPTGSVIERGTTGNGSFTKYADGTLICFIAHSTASEAIATAYFGGFRSPLQSWVFPMGFVSAPVVSVVPTLSSAFGAITTAISATGYNFAYTAITSQTAAARSASIVAVGRWF